MEISTTTLVELKADEGMILVGPDGYGATIYYLGIYDSPDNYTEMPIEEYVEPEPQKEVIEEVEFEEQEEPGEPPEEKEEFPEPPEPPELEEPEE
jgi:hypothetical protein